MEQYTSRSQWVLLHEILDFLRLNEDVARSRIERYVALTSRDMKKHFDLLQEKGYMTINKEDYGARPIYVCNATEKGLELREKIQSVYNMYEGERPKW